MFTSPLASLTGWTWSRTLATDLPAPLRLAFPPSGPGTTGAGATPVSEQFAVRGSGPVTGLRFPASGRWRHAQQSGSDVHWVWGHAADVLVHGAMRTRLPLGNPLVALRFVDATDATTDKGEPEGVARGDPVELNGTPVSTTQVTVVACIPGAPGLDTLGVLRYLAGALDAEALTVGSPTWQAFVAQLATLEQPLRVLEPGGSPATGHTIRVQGGAGPVTLTPTHQGDALTALGVTRAALAGRTLDVSAGDDVIATANGAPFPDGLVPITTATSHLTVATLENWLSPQQSAVLARFTRGNVVRPFADGVETFADLFTELNRAVDAGPLGAFYVTGYSLHHDATLGPEGAATPLRTVQEIAEEMARAGGDPRFLALQMLQLNPTWVRDVETTAAIVALLLSTAGAVATAFQTDSASDQATFFLHAQAIAAGLFIGAGNLDTLLDSLELNRDAIDALDALNGVEAHLDPVDMDVDDNPRAQTANDIVSLALQAQRRFAVFHQKIQVVRNAGGIHAYCGGIDLNPNRTQTTTHASRSPFHDVHARVNGRAAGELTTTFIERWDRASTTTLTLAAADALAGLPTAGPDVVQVARTYYRPLAGSGRGFTDFAPDGESTILETLVAAIRRARRYIYIEDQYLTPPLRLTSALRNAAAAVSGPLIIIVPGSPDQPFGLPRRQAFIQDMQDAWGDRVKVGILRKRFSHASTSITAATGRLWLAEPLGETADIVELAPADRVPSTPFWMTVDGEAMRAYQTVAGFTSPTSSRLHVERADASRLFGATSGTARKEHKKSAPVAAGSFPSIYVHSKMMLIDDAFASIGSANANRRGYYSDGECNIFALRETVADGDNWIRNLRLGLWAEHLGVTPEYARTALLDPAAGLGLFDRKFTVGNRFTTFAAQPYATDLALANEFVDTTSKFGGVLMVAKFAAGIAAAIAGAESDAIFDTVVDPSSELEGP
jgi:phosphatidylserine/phosphatidylglycerophosphate/cardiolipin synthase-like enzyme